jgi:hypothetical protein
MATTTVSEPPAKKPDPKDVGWERLEDQLSWYERKSKSNQQWFRWLKVLQIVVAASIPVAAALGAGAALGGALGAVIVVLEGLQQLFQFQSNWTSYRSTAEALKREKYLYLAQAGVYSDKASRDRLLAVTVETLVSDETAKWSATQRELTRGDQQG